MFRMTNARNSTRAKYGKVEFHSDRFVVGSKKYLRQNAEGEPMILSNKPFNGCTKLTVKENKTCGTNLTRSDIPYFGRRMVVVEDIDNNMIRITGFPMDVNAHKKAQACKWY